MKRSSVVSCLLLAVPLASLAQEANPFVKPGQAKAAAAPPGGTMVNLVEQILVPRDLLDPWLAKNGDDPGPLRQAVQEWVNGGKAKLDHTAFTRGVLGRNAKNATKMEQMYPTEFEPNGPDVWPVPTSYETRDVGFIGEYSSERVGEGWRNGIWFNNVTMLPSPSWNALMERTKKEGDIFCPTFRSTRYDHSRSSPRTSEGPVALLGRNDPPATGIDTGETMTKLTFLRTAFSAAPVAAKPGNEVRTLSGKALRVSHATYSAWLQNRDLLKASTEAWSEFGEGAAGAETISGGTVAARIGGKPEIENLVEFIYPTEWEPAGRRTLTGQWIEEDRQSAEKRLRVVGRYKVESILGMGGASQATSFETRNLGFVLAGELSSDEAGLLLKMGFERVLKLDDVVNRRIEVNGDWIPDVVMPLLASQNLATEVRLEPGVWTLAGSGAEFAPPRLIDREHCVLIFVKVE